MIWPSESQIGRIQIELSNYCNANCSECERDFLKSRSISDPDFFLNTKFITLSEIKKTFIQGRWDNLDNIHFCGNVDEPTTNPELLDIINHFWFLPNKPPQLWISTNGGTRNEKFWTNLGKLSYKLTKKHKRDGLPDRFGNPCGRRNGVYVVFGIDGLKDTNHIYRKNVNWESLKRNWRAFINAGGEAHWQFIIFPWNNHQIKDAEIFALKENFKKFYVKENYHVENRVEYEYDGMLIQ